MSYLKTLLVLCSFLFLSATSFGQNITGPTTVEPGAIETYTYDDGMVYRYGHWTATNGQVVEENNSGTAYTLIVLWGSVGSGSVSFRGFNGTLIETLAVTVADVPAAPTIVTERNHIYNITPRIESTDVSTLSSAEKIANITYLDGLGRAVQQIGIEAGGNKEDVITHIEYDDYGRQNKDYLSYALTSNNGAYRTDAQSATENYIQQKFSGVNNPYSEKHFEDSPLSRVLEQGAPGTAWVVNKSNDTDHTIKFDYDTNDADDVKKYWVTLTYSGGSNSYEPTLNGGGSSDHYPADELYKMVTKDENWTSGTAHTTEEYKNKQGRVILKRTYGTSVVNGSTQTNAPHDTYYVYDDHGNLTYVLPPKVEPHAAKPDAIELSELCYQYKYDNRNRLIEKKIPGKGWEYIVYNKLDQPILTQDANLDAQNKWLFTKYDVFGRVAFTGVINSSGNRALLQTQADADPDQYVERSSLHTVAGIPIYYTNDGYPSWANEVHTVNYYDDYIDLPSGLSNSVTSYGITSSTNVKGLPTVSKVRVLGTSSWITTVTYYDKGRAIYTYTKNDYLGTTDIVELKLDFTGAVLESRTTHQKTGNADIITTETYTYDHQGRVIEQIQYLNDEQGELIARNNYDELGQLVKKDVGGETTSGSAFKDIVNIDVSGQTISKTLNSNSWNAGLATKGEITGDGYIEYEITQTDKALMVGLSSDNSSAHYNTIDFAIYHTYLGGIKAYESGVNKGGFGTYSVGDILRVERVGSTIYYKRNGNTFYTSTVASTGKLIGDISISTYQGKIKNLNITSNYTDVTGVAIDQDIITKTASTAWGNSGLATAGSFDEDGYVQYKVPQTNKDLMVGLSNTNNDATYGSIRYAIYNVANGDVHIYEWGYYKGNFGAYQAGDIFTVERVNTQIHYKKNGVIFYTSLDPSTGTLLGDAAFLTNNAKIEDLKIVDSSLGLQQVDYNYNVRGWLTDINDVNNLGDDLFTFNIRYDNPATGTPLYNGNISQTYWRTKNTDQSLKNYVYTYDALNRIKTGVDNTGHYNLSQVKYDKNGNIHTLNRVGEKVDNPDPGNGSHWGQTDALAYYYTNGGNKLHRVRDASYDTRGFKEVYDGSNEMTYDVNGNMTRDLNKDITNIDYNHLNLPTQVTISGQNISYVYDALGVKQRKTVGGINTDYAGNYVYENNNLQFFNHSEGYVTPDGSSFNYIYQYKDHLGNVRLSYHDADANGTIATSEIIEENNYYPFGLKHKGYNSVVNSGGNSVANKFKYNGKELNEELGLDWYDYGTRQFDPTLGRFMAVDIASEIMKQYSPYVYSYNSPVMFQDMDGNFPTLAVGTDPTDPPKGLTSGKKIDMTNAPQSSARNAKGFPRNSRWFWKQMAAENPRMFSAKNLQLIKAGVAPIVDPQWVEFNPSHAGYKGKLVHHHVDQGRFAVGIPDQAHKKYFSKIHSRYGAKAKNFFRGSMKFLNSVAGVFVAFDLFSDNPHSLGMKFEEGIGVQDNKLYHDSENDNYYEVNSRTNNFDEDGNLESVTAEITVYSDYTYNKKTGKYEGSGESRKTTVTQYKGERAREFFIKLQRQ